MSVAGAAGGSFALADALREGAAAGASAAAAAGFSAAAPRAWRTAEEAGGLTALWYVAGSKGKAFVDFQHDVTLDDVALAAREGFRSVELLKRYTTLGMATDQGKTLQHQRTRHHGCAHRARHPRCRHHHLAPALHSRRHRRLCLPSPRQALQADAAHRRSRLGRGNAVPPSSRPGNGCAPNGLPHPAKRIGGRPSRAKSRRCATESASATSRPWAKSISRARIPRPFSTASTPTCFPLSPSAAYATD